jgi:hypothetical protein
MLTPAVTGSLTSGWFVRQGRALGFLDRPTSWARDGARRALIALVAGVITLGIGVATAQELVLPPIPESPAPAPAPPREAIYRLGSFDLHVRAGASVRYDDNIFIQETNKVDDVVWSIQPGFTLTSSDMTTNGGKSLMMSYDPTLVFFTHRSDQNTFNQAGVVSAALAFTKLSLGLSEAITSGTDPVVEAGTRSEHLLSTTALTSRYAFGEKLSAEMNFGLSISDYSSRNTSWDWSNHDWVNYQYSEKLNAGVGLALGYIDMKGYPDQNYEDLLFRAIYRATDKLDVNGTVGVDWRQYRSGVSDDLSPIWDVAAVYRPRESTTLRLGLYQRYYSSAYYGNEDYLSTGLDVGVHQTFLTRYTFDLVARYDRLDYRSTQTGVDANRTDNVFSVRPQIRVSLGDQWTASVFYEFSHDDSNVQSFTRNVVGVQAQWAY